MIVISNIKQLKESKSYTSVYLEKIWDSSTTNSGGFFVWDSESIDDEILGLIVKPNTAPPLSGVKGRWIRQYSGPINVDWFGVSNKNQTCSTQGVSAADIANYYINVNFEVAPNASFDTLDTVAISYAFQLIKIGYSDIQFSPKNYYINRTLFLPKKKDKTKAYDNGGSPDHNITKITGPGYLKTVNTNNFTVIKRPDPINQNEAEDDMQFDAYIIENLNIRATSNQSHIYLNSSYMSIIRNCFFTGGSNQLILPFAMKAMVEGCHFRYFSGKAIDIGFGNGTWAFASNQLQGTQSNGSTVKNCRFVCDFTNCTPVFVNGCDSVSIEDCTWEGPQDPDYNVIFDVGPISTVIKSFNISRGHIENKPINAAFKIISCGGVYTIDGVFIHQKLQRFLDVKAKSGNSTYVIENIPFNVWDENGHTFSYDNSISSSSFEINNCEFDQNIHSASTRWVGGNKPPAYVAPGSGYAVRHKWVPR